MAYRQRLHFQDIAHEIERSQSGALSATTLSARLSRGVEMVERALVELQDMGVIAPRNGAFVLTGSPVPSGGVESVRFFDDEDNMAPQLERAENIWARRMGNLRWQDDPRANGEAHWGPHFLPAWR